MGQFFTRRNTLKTRVDVRSAAAASARINFTGVVTAVETSLTPLVATATRGGGHYAADLTEENRHIYKPQLY